MIAISHGNHRPPAPDQNPLLQAKRFQSLSAAGLKTASDRVTFGADPKETDAKTDESSKDSNSTKEAKEPSKAQSKAKSKSMGVAGVLFNAAELILFPFFPTLAIISLIGTSIGILTLSKISGAKFDKKSKTITNRQEAETRLKNCFSKLLTLPVLLLPLSKTRKENLRNKISQSAAEHAMVHVEKRKSLGLLKWVGLLALLFIERKFAGKYRMVRTILNWTIFKNWRTAAQQGAVPLLKKVITPK